MFPPSMTTGNIPGVPALYEGEKLQGVFGLFYLDARATGAFDTVVGALEHHHADIWHGQDQKLLPLSRISAMI